MLLSSLQRSSVLVFTSVHRVQDLVHKQEGEFKPSGWFSAVVKRAKIQIVPFNMKQASKLT